jgi:hypothetical protein
MELQASRCGRERSESDGKVQQLMGLTTNSHNFRFRIGDPARIILFPADTVDDMPFWIASTEDLHRRVGGGCATHNMKMIFRVADNSLIQKGQQDNILEDPINNLVEMEEEISAEINTEAPKKYVNGGRRFKYQKNSNPNANYRDIYYYHPSDLINEVDTNTIYQSRSNEALRYTSGAQNVKEISVFGLALALSTLLAFL